MNFLSVKETVEKARIKAAEAAKKLSLNEMAKHDDYIHSEGLNIRNKHHNHNSSSTISNGSRNGGSGSSSSNYKKKNEDYLSNGIITGVDEIGNGKNDRNDRSNIDYDYYTNKNNNNNNNANDDDNDDDSVDSYDQGHDPILQLVKTQQRSFDNNDHYYNSYDTSSIHSNSTNQQQQHHQQQTLEHQQQQSNNIIKKKDPNRFLADLDARLAAPTPTPTPSNDDNDDNDTHENKYSQLYSQSYLQSEQSPFPKNNVFESFTKSENKLHWLRNAVSSPSTIAATSTNSTTTTTTTTNKLQQSLNNVFKQVPGINTMNIKYNPLSFSDHNNKNTTNHDIEMGGSSKKQSTSKKVIQNINGENITIGITSSSNLNFNQSEQDELQRLMNKHKSSSNQSILTRILTLSSATIDKQHRNYIIVGMTFVLTFMGYWYSRKKNEDNVT